MYYAGSLFGYLLDPIMWVPAIILAYRLKKLTYVVRSIVQVLVGMVLVVILYAQGGDALDHPFLIFMSVVVRSLLLSYVIKPPKEFRDASEVAEIRCEIGQVCVRSYIDSGDVSAWYGAMSAHLRIGRALPKVLPLYVSEYANSGKGSQDKRDRALLMLEEINGLNVSPSNTEEAAAMMEYKVNKDNPRLAKAIKTLDLAEVGYSLIGRR